MEDDPQRPHVDLGVVAVFVRAPAHLRRDVRKRAVSRARALCQPFRVVEVAELDADRKRGRDQDVLALRQQLAAGRARDGETDRWRDVAMGQLRCRQLGEDAENGLDDVARPRFRLRRRAEDEGAEIPERVVFHRDVDEFLVLVPSQHPHHRDRVGPLPGVSTTPGLKRCDGETHVRQSHAHDPTADHRPVVDVRIFAAPHQPLHGPHDGRWTTGLAVRGHHEVLDLDDAAAVRALQHSHCAPCALTVAGDSGAGVRYGVFDVVAVEVVLLR